MYLGRSSVVVLGTFEGVLGQQHKRRHVNVMEYTVVVVADDVAAFVAFVAFVAFSFAAAVFDAVSSAFSVVVAAVLKA
jgi:hypothetical protein